MRMYLQLYRRVLSVFNRLNLALLCIVMLLSSFGCYRGQMVPFMEPCDKSILQDDLHCGHSQSICTIKHGYQLVSMLIDPQQ